MLKTYQVKFTVVEPQVNFERNSWIYSAIDIVLEEGEKLDAIVHEPVDDGTIEVTALISIKDFQPSPRKWLPQVLDENLEGNEAISDFVEVEVASDDFEYFKKSIVNKILKLNADV